MHHSDAPKDEEPSPKDPAEAVAAPAHTQEDFPARPHLPQNMPVCPGINALRGRTQFEGTPACLRYWLRQLLLAVLARISRVSGI